MKIDALEEGQKANRELVEKNQKFQEQITNQKQEIQKLKKHSQTRDEGQER